MSSPVTAVVVGNPNPRSRTLTAALHVARELIAGEPDLVVDLADHGGAVLELYDAVVAHLVEQVASAELVVVASPTYKAGCTGLLKCFLDRFPHEGLRGVVAVPLMLGAGPGHALAVETSLRPVLVELGAQVPGRGLYLLETDHADPDAYAGWLESTRPAVARLLRTDSPTPAGA